MRNEGTKLTVPKDLREEKEDIQQLGLPMIYKF